MRVLEVDLLIACEIFVGSADDSLRIVENPVARTSDVLAHSRRVDLQVTRDTSGVRGAAVGQRDHLRQDEPFELPPIIAGFYFDGATRRTLILRRGS